jgi:hypothetical protein
VTPVDLFPLLVTGVLEMAATESTIRFSGHTLDKATKAKVSPELGVGLSSIILLR